MYTHIPVLKSINTCSTKHFLTLSSFSNISSSTSFHATHTIVFYPHVPLKAPRRTRQPFSHPSQHYSCLNSATRFSLSALFFDMSAYQQYPYAQVPGWVPVVWVPVAAGAPGPASGPSPTVPESTGVSIPNVPRPFHGQHGQHSTAAPPSNERRLSPPPPYSPGQRAAKPH